MREVKLESARALKDDLKVVMREESRVWWEICRVREVLRMVRSEEVVLGLGVPVMFKKLWFGSDREMDWDRDSSLFTGSVKGRG